MTSLSAEAGVFKITPGTAAGAFAGQQAAFETFLKGLEDQVNSKLPAVETGAYTKGMANATAMATTGTAVTYGSAFSMALVGVNAGLGVDLGKGNSLSDLDPKKVAGFGAQAAVVVGFNPAAISDSPWGPIDPKRLKLFLSFMKLDRKVDTADISFSNLGVLGQYRLIAERPLGHSTLRWGGVDVTSGFRTAKMKATVVQELEVEYEDPGASGVTATVKGPATFGADVNVFSIPVEVSTSLRVAYVLNLIGGVATDFNFGSSEAIANYNSNIDLNGNGNATGALDLGSKTKPTMINARAFAGLGFNLGVGTLNFVLGKSLTASAWSIDTGLNFFW